MVIQLNGGTKCAMVFRSTDLKKIRTFIHRYHSTTMFLDMYFTSAIYIYIFFTKILWYTTITAPWYSTVLMWLQTTSWYLVLNMTAARAFWLFFCNNIKQLCGSLHCANGGEVCLNKSLDPPPKLTSQDSQRLQSGCSCCPALGTENNCPAHPPPSLTQSSVNPFLPGQRFTAISGTK